MTTCWLGRGLACLRTPRRAARFAMHGGRFVRAERGVRDRAARVRSLGPRERAARVRVLGGEAVQQHLNDSD